MSSWPEIPLRSTLEIRKGIELNERYVIGDLLGSGGFGTVWRATDKIGSRDVAIKRLFRWNDQSSTAAVLAEAENIKKVTGHKNIVQLYETFVEKDEAFLVMEFVEGKSLQEILKRHIQQGSWLDLDEAVDYLKQILEALIYAHSSGVYHRDITPANILISDVGLVKLTDFGLAKAMTDEIRSHGKGEFAWSGTVHYMSSEQARGESLSHLTDIMSVGIVAYIMMTGRHPFNHPSAILTVGDLIKDQQYVCPNPIMLDGKPLKAVLAEILRKMLYKEKSARYQSLVEPLGLLLKDDSMQCQHCLHSNPKANKFCGECGNSLQVQATPPQSAGPSISLTAEQLTIRGFGKTRINDWDGAIEDYREALKVDAQHAAAYANLGFALNRKGDYEEAIKAGKKGLISAKDDGIRHRLYDVIGFASYSLNNPKEAIKNYTDALRLRDNPRVYVNRAEARAATGDIPEAYEDVLSALEIDEDYLPASRLRARLDRLL